MRSSNERPIPNYFFKSPKYFKLHLFLQILVEELVKLEKLLRILVKLLDPQVTFYKSESSFVVDKPRKNIF